MLGECAQKFFLIGVCDQSRLEATALERAFTSGQRLTNETEGRQFSLQKPTVDEKTGSPHIALFFQIPRFHM